MRACMGATCCAVDAEYQKGAAGALHACRCVSRTDRFLLHAVHLSWVFMAACCHVNWLVCGVWHNVVATVHWCMQHLGRPPADAPRPAPTLSCADRFSTMHFSPRTPCSACPRFCPSPALTCPHRGTKCVLSRSSKAFAIFAKGRSASRASSALPSKGGDSEACGASMAAAASEPGKERVVQICA